MVWSVTREPDDKLAKTRLSMGTPRGTTQGAYLVFRGEPEDIIRLLEDAVEHAVPYLRAKNYNDKRGRPQG
jgi:hypothetical protein